MKGLKVKLTLIGALAVEHIQLQTESDKLMLVYVQEPG